MLVSGCMCVAVWLLSCSEWFNVVARSLVGEDFLGQINRAYPHMSVIFWSLVMARCPMEAHFCHKVKNKIKNCVRVNNKVTFAIVRYKVALHQSKVILGRSHNYLFIFYSETGFHRS